MTQTKSKAEVPPVVCSVCDEIYTKAYFKKITPSCTHETNICNACVKESIMNIVNGGSFAAKSSYQSIACPTNNCKSHLNSKDIQVFLSAEEFGRWETLASEEWAEAQPEFRWCSNATCGSGQLVDGGEDANSFFTCYKCRAMTCIRHRVPMHKGVSCDEYEKTLATDERALVDWKAKNTKACPKCNVPIEKNGGCDHMNCKHCKHAFCWSCLAEFAPILRHGNHHHKPTCRFFAPWNGKDKE